jgi:octaprenyl-diphosphate synthase
VGKPIGIDIKEKKMTLPLIFALNNSGYLEKRGIINIVKNKSEDQKKVKEVIDFVKAKGGIEYANIKMHEYKELAFSLLNELPNSEAKEYLKSLIDYVVSRDH